MLIVIGGISYLADIFSECVNHKEIAYLQHDVIQTREHRDVLFQESRIIFSCLIYCLIIISKHFMCKCYMFGVGTASHMVYSRLFRNKTYIGVMLNMFVIWLVLLNLLSISLLQLFI